MVGTLHTCPCVLSTPSADKESKVRLSGDFYGGGAEKLADLLVTD